MLKLKSLKQATKRDPKAVAAQAARLAKIVKAVSKSTKGKIQLQTFELPKALSKDKAIGTGWPVLDDLLSGQWDDAKCEVVPGSGYGVPRGRIIELYGAESSGKTTLATQILASAIKAGAVGAFVDAEHAFDPEYGGKLGLDLQSMIYSAPDSAETALEEVKQLALQGVDLIVLDSVAALTPDAELKGHIAKKTMGVQARLMSQALRQLGTICGETGTTVIFLNQIRLKLGVMFGNPETTPGGNALKFYSSIRLELRKMKNLVKNNVAHGALVKCKTVKNKVVPALRAVTLRIKFGRGVVDVVPFSKDDKE